MAVKHLALQLQLGVLLSGSNQPRFVTNGACQGCVKSLNDLNTTISIDIGICFPSCFRNCASCIIEDSKRINKTTVLKEKCAHHSITAPAASLSAQEDDAGTPEPAKASLTIYKLQKPAKK